MMKRTAVLLVPLALMCMGVTRCGNFCGDTPTHTPSGTYTSTYQPSLSGEARIRADAATFEGSDNVPPVILDGTASPATQICFQKGLVEGQWATNSTWSYMHDTVGGVNVRNFGGVEIKKPTAIARTTIVNMEDGIRLRDGSAGTVIHDVHMEHIFDDCLDDHHSIGNFTAKYSFFDGCYVFLSTDDTIDATSQVITLQWNLIRLEGNPNPHSSELTNGVLVEPYAGHGSFFKWQTLSPHVKLEHNLFRADGCTKSESHQLFPEKVVLDTCVDNVLVWGGDPTDADENDYPDEFEECFNDGNETSAWRDSNCLTVTTLTELWDDAVADWVSGAWGSPPTTTTTP